MKLMGESEARLEICRVGKSLFDRGYVHSSAGNISVRLEDGFLITPTDAVLGFLEPNRISKVSLSGEHLSGDRPSKTLALHQAIVKAAQSSDVITGVGLQDKPLVETSNASYPQTACVIHTHSTYCVALSILLTKLGQGSVAPELLRPITTYFVMKVGHVPLIDYRRPGDLEVPTLVVKAIQEYAKNAIPIRSVMLSALGPLVWHDTPAQAMATLEELEESAKLSYLLGAQELKKLELQDSQIAQLKEVFKAVW